MGLSSPHRGKMGVPPPQRGQPPVALVLILCIGLVCTAGAYNRWLRTEGENSAGTGASGSAASKPGRGIGSSGPKPTPTLHRVAPSSPSGENSPTASSSSSLKPADPAEKKTYTMRTSSADGERTRDIRSTFASAGETKTHRSRRNCLTFDNKFEKAVAPMGQRLAHLFGSDWLTICV